MGMDIIKRYKLLQLKTNIVPGKVTILYGARRVGKTTLMNLIRASEDGITISLNGDFPQDRDLITSRTESLEALLAWLSGVSILFVDEAQSIEQIGSILKRIIDAIPTIRIVASGSASFELAQQVGEPLVGRSRTLRLHQLAWFEVYKTQPTETQFNDLLIYGSYPSVVTLNSYEQKKVELSDIVNGHLLKDALNLEGLRDSSKVRDLLKLIAFQVGSEVSITELSSALALPRATVEKYLDLFEKCFVIFRLGGFSRNLRKEVSKSYKYYFWDVGIRNGIIGNYNELSDRDDVGKLWENAMIVERIKADDRSDPFLTPSNYFWRTYDQQEIDLLQEKGSELTAYEYKYSATARAPKGFTTAYPEARFMVINKNNYWEAITS
jgi:uncharacterized protein